MGFTHAKPSWRYWFDFVLFPPIAFATIVIFCRDLTWVAFCVIGFVVWTFVEYWAHRSLLHVWFWHATHQRHHTHPEEFVVFPLWRLPAFFAAIFISAYWLGLESLFAGFVLGYVWFLALHHMLHHWSLDKHKWLKAYSNWHDLHHRRTHCNYGITVPIWDFVFLTYKSAKR